MQLMNESSMQQDKHTGEEGDVMIRQLLITSESIKWLVSSLNGLM